MVEITEHEVERLAKAIGSLHYAVGPEAAAALRWMFNELAYTRRLVDTLQGERAYGALTEFCGVSMREAMDMVLRRAEADERLTEEYERLLALAESYIRDRYEGTSEIADHLAKLRPDTDHPMQRAVLNANLTRWCVNVLGPDDVYAATSYQAAVESARRMSSALWAVPGAVDDVPCFAVAAPWPGDEASFTANLAAQAARSERPAVTNIGE